MGLPPKTGRRQRRSLLWSGIGVILRPARQGAPPDLLMELGQFARDRSPREDPEFHAISLRESARRGAVSKKISVPGIPINRRERGAPFAGFGRQEATKKNRSLGRPDIVSAAKAAKRLEPERPAGHSSRAARTSLCPGSETERVPASLTSARRAPWRNRSNSFTRIEAAL